MSAPWLAELPNGWQEIALRYLARIETGSRDTVDAVPGGEYPFIIRSQTPLEIDTYSYDTEAVLTAGDGAVGEIFHHINGRFEVHQRVYVMHDFHGLDGRYFYYYFSSEFGQTVAYGGAQSTVASLRRPMFTGFPVAVPPLEVQRAIADYLDRETAQIDAFIAKNEELITLLTERRAAVIDRAMDRLASFKLKLKYRLTLNTGGVWGEDPTGVGDSVVLRSTEQTVDGKWRLSSPAERSLSRQDARRFRLHEGDLVVTKSSGSEAHIGKATLVDAEVAGLAPAYSNFMQRLVPSGDMNSKFLWYALRSRSVRDQLNLKTTSTTGLGNLNGGILGELLIPSPPIDEQAQTVAALDQSVKGIETAIEVAERVVALARERRAALISAAVTGKIDVGVAA